jgi:hypothetical protein
MKSLLLFSLLMMPLFGWSQIYRIDPDTRKLTYMEVTEVPGAPKEELFSRARMWFELEFAYGLEVSMTEWEEEGELVIRCRMPLKVRIGAVGEAHYTLTLSLRDGKYRYLITDFSFQHPNRQPMAYENHLLRPQLKIFAKTDEKMQLLIASLHQKMIRKVSVSANTW